MDKKTVMSKIFIDDIFPILSKDVDLIKWPSNYSLSDKIGYLNNVIKFYEYSEDYYKCNTLIEVKNKLEKMYDNKEKS